MRKGNQILSSLKKFKKTPPTLKEKKHRNCLLSNAFKKDVDRSRGNSLSIEKGSDQQLLSTWAAGGNQEGEASFQMVGRLSTQRNL